MPTRESFRPTEGQKIFHLVTLPCRGLLVYRNGLLQCPGHDYQVTGNQVEFYDSLGPSEDMTFIAFEAEIVHLNHDPEIVHLNHDPEKALEEEFFNRT